MGSQTNMVLQGAGAYAAYTDERNIAEALCTYDFVRAPFREEYGIKLADAPTTQQPVTEEGDDEDTDDLTKLYLPM